MAPKRSRAWDFYVAIPSYKRSDVIGSKTLALLKRHRVPQTQVYIFVSDADEEKLYRKALGSEWKNIVVGVPTLWRQRNFITKYFSSGSHVISFDDDVEELCYLDGEPTKHNGLKVLHDGALLEIIADARVKMHKTGAYIWALNTSHNTLFMKHCVSLRNGLCNGFFWGCIVRHDQELMIRDGDVHEDVQRSVAYFSQDGAVLRYRGYCAKTRCYTNKGGMQADRSAEQRMTEQAEAVQRLCKQFPLMLRATPGTRLGLTFCPRISIGRDSLISLAMFSSLVASQKVGTLAGSVVGILDLSSGRCFGGKLKFVRSDLCTMGLVQRNGQRLLFTFEDFYSALREEMFAVVRMPDQAYDALQLEKPVEQEPLPEYFLSEGLVNVTPSVAVQPHPGPPPSLPEKLSEFAKNLSKLMRKDDDIEGEEDAQESKESKEKQPAVHHKRDANVCRKRQTKLEGDAWIESQRTLFPEMYEEGEVASVKEEVLDLKSWEISVDFEEALQSASVQNCKAGDSIGGAVRHAFFCRARIWGGGWGSQCTHPRMLHSCLCSMHKVELGRQGYLTHGRIDGAVPPKKRDEMQAYQAKLLKGQSQDTGANAEEAWRGRERGPSESDRAYAMRTGIVEQKESPQSRVKKKPKLSARASANQISDVAAPNQPPPIRQKRKASGDPPTERPQQKRRAGLAQKSELLQKLPGKALPDGGTERVLRSGRMYHHHQASMKSQKELPKALTSNIVGKWYYGRAGRAGAYTIKKNEVGRLTFNEAKIAAAGELEAVSENGITWLIASLRHGALRLRFVDGAVLSQLKKNGKTAWGKVVVARSTPTDISACT